MMGAMGSAAFMGSKLGGGGNQYFLKIENSYENMKRFYKRCACFPNIKK